MNRPCRVNVPHLMSQLSIMFYRPGTRRRATGGRWAWSCTRCWSGTLPSAPRVPRRRTPRSWSGRRRSYSRRRCPSRRRPSNAFRGRLTIKALFSVYRILDTVETGYKVAIHPRGNLLIMRIYLITDHNLLLKDIVGLWNGYFTTDFTLYPVTFYPVSTEVCHCFLSA